MYSILPTEPRRTVEEDAFRLTLPEIAAFVRRYALTIAAVFALTVVTAYGALNLMSEQYEAQSSLLVKLGRENLDPPPTARNAVFSTGLRREEIASEITILRSPDLLGQTVDAIGVGAFTPARVRPAGLVAAIRFYAKAAIRAVRTQFHEALIALDLEKRLNDREAAVSTLERALVAEPEKDSDVIALRLRLTNPALAVRVENTLIGLYLQRRINVRHNPGVREFLEARSRELWQALENADAAVNTWKREMNLSAPADQKALLLKQIRELTSERDRVLSERETLRRQIGSAEELIARSPDRVQAAKIETPNPSLQVVRERLAKLEADRAKVVSTYQPQASTVRTLNDEIEGLRTLLAEQPATEVGSVTSELNPLRQRLEGTMQDARVRVEGLTASAATQHAQLVNLERELRSVEQGDAKLAELERDRRIAEQKYLGVAARRDDADIAAQLDLDRISNVSIATPPSASLEPVAPRKLLIMGVALAVGLLLGIAVALLLEWTSDDVRDPEHLERVAEMKYLGTVAFSPRPQEVA